MIVDCRLATRSSQALAMRKEKIKYRYDGFLNRDSLMGWHDL